MNINTKWDQANVDTLVRMRNDGASVPQIADELGKTRSSVKMFIARHKDELGLRPRIDFKAPAKSCRPQFDKDWYGQVPFGHWLITKSWGKAS